LVVGGVFNHAGAVAANQVARFRSGAWSAMGSLDIGGVAALQLHDGGLGTGNAMYAAGGFAGRVARWDGSAWTTIGNGIDYPVMALASFNEDGVQKLIAGGNFAHAGSGVANHVASWNGSSWAQVGSGLNSQVNVLCTIDGWLYAGGFFDHSGSLPVSGVARWGCKTGGGAPPGLPIQEPLPLKRPRLQLSALPNPARGAQTLQLVLPQTVEVDARLYDAAGRLVRVMAKGRYLAGLHALTWDGKDDRGEAVGLGIYILRVQTEQDVRSLKLMRLP
jgi:hypothetical protein